MENYINRVEEFWQIRDSLSTNSEKMSEGKLLINEIFTNLNEGKLTVCYKTDNIWQINEWIKKAILLNFRLSNMKIYENNFLKWYDKIDLKFQSYTEKDFEKHGFRAVPGAFVRSGCYIGKSVVLMPCFVNVGAYIGDRTMIDTWASVGSCAYIGNNCHISGGAGIGGVLEPIQAKPVIIEDNCFIGARSEIVEGVVVGEGAVIGMGTFIGSSTKIVDRYTGEVTYGKIPPYSVVVPGSFPADKPGLPSLYCAVIIKQVDQNTRAKTSINELLRG